MKITVIEARDLEEAWWRSMKEVLENGHEYVIQRGSFEGHKRKEFDLVAIRVACPNIRPIVPSTPIGVPPPTSIEYINDYLPYLMSDSRKPDEEYTYGMYLESQIPKIVDMLRRSPQTNQAYMTVGDPSTVDMKDPPCLRGIHCQVKYSMLNFIVYFRSWDLWGGFPSNLAAIQLMKEYMASEIGIGDGELLCLSGGLHLYDHQWEFARAVVKEQEK